MSLSPVLGKSFRSRYKSRSLAEYLGRDCVEAEPIWGHNSLHVIHHPSPHPSLAQHPATSRSGCSYLKWKKLLTVFRTPFFWQGQLYDTEHVMLLISEWNKRVHKRTRKKGNLKLWLILHRAGGWPIQNEFVSFCRSTVDMTVAEPGLSPDPRHPCLCTGPGQPGTKRRPPPGHIYPLYLPTCSTAAPPTPAPARKSALKYFIGTWLYFPF